MESSKEKFTKKQKLAFDTSLKGNNTFISGGAGTGKSFLLKTIVKELQQHGKNVLVTTPTGMAATLIDGATLHRTFSLSIGPNLYGKAKKSVLRLLKNTDVVIIDEISMCSVDVFDTVAFYIETENKRRKNKKLSLIQLIVFGDFFQLPPIVRPEEKKILNQFYKEQNIFIDEGFAFEGYYWNRFNFTNIILEEVVRQKDETFVHNLNMSRVGQVASVDYFNNHSAKNINELSEKAIFLAGKKADVNAYNKKKLAELPTKERKFIANKTGTVNKGDMIVPETLILKENCRVLFSINNENLRFVNGSMGTVKKFVNGKILIELDNGRMVELSRYTYKIYKYVAKEKLVEDRSRGTKIFDDKPDDEIVVDPKTNKETTNFVPEMVKRTVVRKEVIGTFEQFPLQLAYAITMHKSQGQTFDEVILDPVAWSVGQLYCALSRVTTIKKLYLAKPIYPRYLKASEEVKQFYDEMGKTRDSEEFVYISVPKYMEKYIYDLIQDDKDRRKLFTRKGES